jgi:hypothetical protein
MNFDEISGTKLQQEIEIMLNGTQMSRLPDISSQEAMELVLTGNFS